MKSEMKRVQNVSSQICRELSPVGVGGGPKIKAAQNLLKHIFVLDFFKSKTYLKDGATEKQ